MFVQTLTQVAGLFLFMIVGYVLSKEDVLSAETPKVLSNVLVWISCPALYLNTFSTQFVPEELPAYVRIMAISVVMLAAAYIISRLLGRVITENEYDRGVFTYSVCVPNYGYFGNVIVLALFGEAVLMEYQIFVIPFSVFTITKGYNMLVDQKTQGLKALINPMTVSMAVGIALGLLRVRMPEFVTDALRSASDLMGPLSMILAGCVISQFDIKRILGAKEVYFTVAARMLLMPLLVLLAGRVLNIPERFFLFMMVFNCLPTGLNSVVYPSTVGKDCSLGAGAALVSNLLAIITVPLFLSLIG